MHGSGDWCRICGTQHVSSGVCPGSLCATGPEYRGWRINVETPRGVDAYGVLLSRSYDRWRARIITFPRILWSIPGGGQTIKFVGKTAEEAEAAARRFIETHCQQHEFAMTDGTPIVAPRMSRAPRIQPQPIPRTPVVLPRPHIPQPQEIAAQKAFLATQQYPRFARELPLRFGQSIPTELAHTWDLSEGGVFVATCQPAGCDDLVGLLLQLEHCTLPLRGSVIWTRRVDEQTHPAGMGIRLLSPPTTYVSYVRALA